MKPLNFKSKAAQWHLNFGKRQFGLSGSLAIAFFLFTNNIVFHFNSGVIFLFINFNNGNFFSPGSVKWN